MQRGLPLLAAFAVLILIMSCAAPLREGATTQSACPAMRVATAMVSGKDTGQSAPDQRARICDLANQYVAQVQSNISTLKSLKEASLQSLPTKAGNAKDVAAVGKKIQ